MAEYPTGSVKYDPNTGSIANRTKFPEVDDWAAHAWMVATTGNGGVTKTSAEVAGWVDIPSEVLAMLAQGIVPISPPTGADSPP